MRRLFSGLPTLLLFSRCAFAGDGAAPDVPEIDAAAESVVSAPFPGLPEGLELGFSFWWVLLFFVLACALLVWMAWQARTGAAFAKGTENIEVVARRMFGPKQGVICVRLRDREFLLGMGGDQITLLSEWRARENPAPSIEEMTDGAVRKNAEQEKA